MCARLLLLGLLLPGLLLARQAAAQVPAPAACPPGLPEGVTCLRGRDANGAYLLLARPAQWHGGLVTFIFGGPRMAPPAADTTDEDLIRFAETVAEGWAWVSTSRRRAGFGVRRAGEDALAARDAAAAAFGEPSVSLLHGQSWGGNVAARAIETLNAPRADRRRPWDGALLSSAVLAGPSRAYDMRVDLRAAFQAICGTHPRPEEPQYPVTLGLPEGAAMAREELMARYTACTGAELAPEQRTPAQRVALADLAAASRVPEWAIPGHLSWATTVFADLAWSVMGGRSAFGNAQVRYAGTSDDAGLNARIPRIAPDPDALAKLVADGDPTGAIGVPVLTVHGIGDTTAFVEHQWAYRATVEAAGTTALLRQVFVDDESHIRLSPPVMVAALAALRDWVRSGVRPAVAEVAARCAAALARWRGECRILPDYAPQPWGARVNPR